MLKMSPPSDGIDALLNPRSIALIGASTAPEKAGGRRWRTLVDGGFEGPLYPVHPRAGEILGRKAYPAVRDIPEPIDVAVVIVSPGDVPRAVADSLAHGARGIILITSGFGEIDQAGRETEAGLARMVRAAGARMIGPNCAGIYSSPAKMNVLGWSMRPGPIALVSQSGNMALDFAELAGRSGGAGFSRAVTIGNAADLKAYELIEYCLRDPATEVVLAYIEGFGPLEGRALCDIVERAPVRKPIVVLKPGRSENGRRAALSHTGALAGEDRVVDAALRQHGILRAEEVEEAWQTALALAQQPAMRGGGVAVLTDGGGHASLFCDAAGLAGLSTPAFSSATRAALAALLPERCPMGNPVDFAGLAEGEPGVIAQALDICLADPEIDAAVMVGHFGGYDRLGGPALQPLELEAAAAIAATASRHGKPVQVHSVHANANPPALAALSRAGVVVHRAIEMPARTLRHLLRASVDRRERKPRQNFGAGISFGGPVPRDAAVGSPPWLQEPEARAFLESRGIAVPAWRVVGSAAECAEAAQELGGKVALKLIAPGAMHKSESGGVLLDIEGGEQAASGYRTLLARAADASLSDARVMVTAMIRGEAELVVGAFRDPQFGPVVMAGMGGVLVEVLDDVSFRLAPISAAEGEEMIQELRGARLLGGFRGKTAVDTRPAAQLLCDISLVMTACPEIAEVDLNPVILAAGRAAIADARIILKAEEDCGAVATADPALQAPGSPAPRIGAADNSLHVGSAQIR